MEPELPPRSEPSPQAEPTQIPSVTSPVLLNQSTNKDRSTGLTIFGVLQIILGIFAALMVPLSMLGVFLSRLGPAGAMQPRQFISSIATYAFMSAILVTLGIGSVQAKRWARSLTLVISWYWLVLGILVTILLTAVLPVAMRSAMAQVQQNTSGAPPGLSTGIMAVILTLIIVFAAVFLVIVPIGLVAFYGRDDVAETCRRRDPVVRWTDRTPLPVLGASIVFFTGALYMAMVGITTPLFPFFGRYLTGIGATGCFLMLAGFDIYLAVALFRLQNTGWWLACGILAVRLVSVTMTFARADLMQAYSKIGFSDAQVRMMSSNPMFRSHAILWWGLFSMVGLFGYLIWIKHYFKNPSAPLSSDPLAVHAN